MCIGLGTKGQGLSTQFKFMSSKERKSFCLYKEGMFFIDIEYKFQPRKLTLLIFSTIVYQAYAFP
jgi:hypothetical protein